MTVPECRGYFLKKNREAVLDLKSYSLAGGKKDALRRNVAKLNRAGLQERWKPRYLVYDRRIPLVRLATSITNAKGAEDPVLYRKYKKFFISLLLSPDRYREPQKEETPGTEV